MLVSGYSSTCRCLWLEITCTYVRLCDDVLNYFIFYFLNGKTIFQLFTMDVWMLECNFRGYDFLVETRLSGLSVFIRTFLRTNIFAYFLFGFASQIRVMILLFFFGFFFTIHIFVVFAIRIELQILFFIYFF